MKFSRFLFLLLRKSNRKRVFTNKNQDVSSDKLIEAKVVEVTDGDGVIVSNSGKFIEIRLFAIDCPEYDQEWGDIAKYGLIKLIGGKTVYLEMHGLDIHQRTLATIYVESKSKLINVNEQMVARGHAWVYRKYYGTLSWTRKNRLDWFVERARERKIGLWKHKNPIPPWEWRKSDSA